MAELIAKSAKEAFDASQLLTSSDRQQALVELEALLRVHKHEILQANQKDLEAAKVLVDAGKMSPTLLKRLDLTSSSDKYDSMLQGILDVSDLPDPTGRITYAKELDQGLHLHRISCPIGVLLIIFEARPEVIINITALAIKSGNAAILKGGKESNHTQRIMTAIIQNALSKTSLPSNYIQTVSSRDEINSLLQQDRYIDLVIPRGGNALVKSIQNGTRIPVMGHADGLCSIYVDEFADERKAIKVVLDSKLTYTSACNSVETLLIHESLLTTVWPNLATSLLAKSIVLKCDPPSLSALSSSSLATSSKLSDGSPQLMPSTEVDYDTEFLEPILAIRTVPSLSLAIQHINNHSSHHTDSIISENSSNQTAFVKGIDSAGVFVNASTRFADGFRYGFGTEVGVSTGKTHARGPVGLEGLVIYKYVVKSLRDEGSGTAEYGVGQGRREYTHRDLEGDERNLL